MQIATCLPTAIRRRVSILPRKTANIKYLIIYSKLLNYMQSILPRNTANIKYLIISSKLLNYMQICQGNVLFNKKLTNSDNIG